MKNLRKLMNNLFDKLNEQWRALPVKKQQRYTILLFAGYTVLTIAMILNVFYDVGKPNHGVPVEHIENPITPQKKSSDLPQDSINNLKK